MNVGVCVSLKGFGPRGPIRAKLGRRVGLGPETVAVHFLKFWGEGRPGAAPPTIWPHSGHCNSMQHQFCIVKYYTARRSKFATRRVKNAAVVMTTAVKRHSTFQQFIVKLLQVITVSASVAIAVKYTE